MPWLDGVYRIVAKGLLHTVADLLEQLGKELHVYADTASPPLPAPVEDEGRPEKPKDEVKPL